MAPYLGKLLNGKTPQMGIHLPHRTTQFMRRREVVEFTQPVAQRGKDSFVIRAIHNIKIRDLSSFRKRLQAQHFARTAQPQDGVFHVNKEPVQRSFGQLYRAMPRKSAIGVAGKRSKSRDRGSETEQRIRSADQGRDTLSEGKSRRLESERHIALSELAMDHLLCGGGQLGPDQVPVIRAKIAACDNTAGSTLDSEAVLDWNRTRAASPLMHDGRRNSNSLCKGGLAPRRLTCGLNGLLVCHTKHFSIAKYSNQAMLNSVVYSIAI
jgi:hypothetical protein